MWGRITIATRWFTTSLALFIAVLVMAVGQPVIPVLAADVQVTIITPGTVPPGANFTVNVNISQVENFDACNYDVSFNPSVLRLDNVSVGQIGATIVPVDTWNETTQGTGIYRIVQNIPGIRGVSGSGYLAVLHFRVIGSGGQSSNINLTNGVLGNTSANAIPALWTGGMVSVPSSGSSQNNSSTSTPFPDIPNPPATPSQTQVPPSETTVTPTPASQPGPQNPAPPRGPVLMGNPPPTPPLTVTVPTPTPTPTGIATNPLVTPPLSSKPSSAKPTNWLMVGGVSGGILLLAAVAGLIVWRAKQEQHNIRHIYMKWKNGG
jgi:hypothetical protein